MQTILARPDQVDALLTAGARRGPCPGDAPSAFPPASSSSTSSPSPSPAGSGSPASQPQPSSSSSSFTFRSLDSILSGSTPDQARALAPLVVQMVQTTAAATRVAVPMEAFKERNLRPATATTGPSSAPQPSAGGAVPGAGPSGGANPSSISSSPAAALAPLDVLMAAVTANNATAAGGATASSSPSSPSVLSPEATAAARGVVADFAVAMAQMQLPNATLANSSLTQLVAPWFSSANSSSSSSNTNTNVTPGGGSNPQPQPLTMGSVVSPAALSNPAQLFGPQALNAPFTPGSSLMQEIRVLQTRLVDAQNAVGIGAAPPRASPSAGAGASAPAGAAPVPAPAAAAAPAAGAGTAAGAPNSIGTSTGLPLPGPSAPSASMLFNSLAVAAAGAELVPVPAPDPLLLSVDGRVAELNRRPGPDASFDQFVARAP